MATLVQPTRARARDLALLPLPLVQPDDLYLEIVEVPKGERLYFNSRDLCARVLCGAFSDVAISTGDRQAILQRYSGADLIDPATCGRSVLCNKAGRVLMVRGYPTGTLLEYLTKSRMAYLEDLRQRLADAKADPLIERLRRLQIPQDRPHGLVTRIAEDIGCSRENVSLYVTGRRT